MSKHYILVFNGTSSSGKSTTAREFQKISNDEKIFLINLDSFVNLLPNEYIGFGKFSDEGFSFKRNKEEISVAVGNLGNIIIDLMAQFILKLAFFKFNIMLDHVILEKGWMNLLKEKIPKNYQIVNILIYCDQEESRKRELARGDRDIGLSDGLKFVEQNVDEYDLTINTTNISPNLAASKILNYLILNRIYEKK